MDVDLYRIRKGQTATRYFPSHSKIYNEQNNFNKDEKKRNGLCFVCGKAEHMQFNCPNRKRPRNVKLINRTLDNEASTSTPISTVRRIKRIDEDENAYRIMDIVEKENMLFKGKTNILDFYIKTNDSEESKVKVLIDSGSDINCIHPEFARVNNINLIEADNPFKVAGLGYGLSTVKRMTEKCILRFKNHLEVIQLYALRIPDVDIILGLPWIKKHCPINYHDPKKIAFSSGFCARHCNVGKRNRKNKKRSNKISIKGKEPMKEPRIKPTNITNKNGEVNYKRKYVFEDDSDSDSNDEVTIRGRCTRIKTCCETPDNTLNTNNFIINYDSDINDSFMFDSDDEVFEFSDNNNIDLDRLFSICKIDNSYKNLNFNVNDKCKVSNKDKSNENYINKKCTIKDLCHL